MPYVTFYQSGNIDNIPAGWPHEVQQETFSGAVFKTDEELSNIIASLQTAKDAWNSGLMPRIDESVFIQTKSNNGNVTEEAWYEWYNGSNDNSGATRKKIYNYTSNTLTSVIENFYNVNGVINKTYTYTFFTEGNSKIQKRT